MRTYDKFYINGQWVEPIGKGTSEVINPATGEVSTTVPYGNAEDVDAAVTAARNAFASWSQTPAATRSDFLRKIAVEGEKRNADLTETIIDELGMPIQNAAVLQVDPLAIICESFADKAKFMEEQKEVGNSGVSIASCKVFVRIATDDNRDAQIRALLLKFHRIHIHGVGGNRIIDRHIDDRRYRA